MTRSRVQRPPRSSGAHGGTRVRYGRLAAVVASFVVTLVSMLGGAGALPEESSSAAVMDRDARVSGPAASLAGAAIPDAGRALDPGAPRSEPSGPVVPEATSPPVPEDSGTGKRVVFDMSDQRVWMVDRDAEGSEVVQSTYLVSGSVLDNLDPGTFEVYSRSRWATGIDDSGVMEYFVRFTRGENAAIGFHSIPTKDGRPLQGRDQLGTPQSHGCIRQALPDAKALWAFAPVGTKVVVTA